MIPLEIPIRPSTVSQSPSPDRRGVPGEGANALNHDASEGDDSTEDVIG